MWSPGQVAPLPVTQVLKSPGQPLPAMGHDIGRGHNFSQVRVHADKAANEAAMMLNARAFAVGPHIVFGPGQYDPASSYGRKLIRHELGHVIQAGGRKPGHRLTMIDSEVGERQARQWPNSQPAPLIGGDAVQRHPAEKVLKWTVKWLSKRTAKQISKHIARHTRTIATRAIHSVFKNPRRVKYIVTNAVKEATEVVGRNAAKLATDTVEEGAIRVVRQATRTPGKFRWVVQKTFVEAIGTGGQRVLRIVIDQSGRIVTAFPADRLIAIGITAAGIEAFSARTAEAAESVHTSIEKDHALDKAAHADNSSWWEWVPIIGDIWGGELNSGEGAMIERDREDERREQLIKDTVEAAIHELEEDKQATLGPDDRIDIEDFVRMVLVSGLDVEQEEVPQESGG